MGWDRTHVVVLQAGDGVVPPGWAVIDAARRQARYGLSDAQVRADAVAGRIPTFSADSAWRQLAGDPLSGRGHR